MTSGRDAVDVDDGAFDDLVFDVVVVGGGVVGCAVARLLSHHQVRVALVEAGPDVGAGTSKAN
ncbi:MAG TPA: FAD-dependent oxidoreductase, partial [Ilumatobacteraceae bacterium]